nr:MAG TPA: hypothetical protein [Bacteriophage sp.]
MYAKSPGVLTTRLSLTSFYFLMGERSFFEATSHHSVIISNICESLSSIFMPGSVV